LPSAVWRRCWIESVSLYFPLQRRNVGLSGGMARESMEYDAVIVGGGPAGLAAAIRLKQLAAGSSVCVLEKGSEIGAHILSGAVLDPVALDALIPDWKAKGAPLEPVTEDRFYFLTAKTAIPFLHCLMPPLMNNRGMFIASLSNLCRWLGQEAEALGVEIYPGFAAAEVLYGEAGEVQGVVTGAFGIAKDGSRKANFTPGMELRAKYTLFAEGARGYLSERLIERYALRDGSEVQKYGLGLKELWQIDPAKHRCGLVLHSMGWPLDNRTGGGLFLYHWGERFCSVGFVLHLNYSNPWLSPFDEFQRAKLHPAIRPFLEGGRRIGFGARAVSEGGFQSVPKLAFPGGALIGCGAGFMNVPRIKGIHNAMASGMLAAEAAAAALAEGRAGDVLSAYEAAYCSSAICRDLKRVRNVKPLWSKLGTFPGVALGGLDMWANQLFGVSPFGTLGHGKPDCDTLMEAATCRPIAYPKPDGIVSFDKSSSLFLSGINHHEDQPLHLRLADPALPLHSNLPKYGEPAQRYCPAGVYEILGEGQAVRFQINAANCLHCKTCEIKDPARNITWLPPEGGGGPNYADM
jgi:electron-transferring-flavoprotein dehydrogenase